jgi:hypothetical protein
MINTSIPGWMKLEELTLLSKIAQAVPENGSILEVGCFLGSSTAALYNGKLPSVKMTVVDNFRGFLDPTLIEKTFRQVNFEMGDPDLYERAKHIAIFSGWQKAFKFCVGDDIYNDLDVHPVASRDFVRDKKYNLTFIDASHYYEDVRNDIKKFMTDTDLLIGDDFLSIFPGVSQAVNQFRGKRTLIVFENTKLWALVPTSGYWRDVFKNNNLLFSGETAQ